MRAVWLENQVLSFRDDIPEPVPRKNDALVRVRLAGICGTDLELVKGYYPFCGIPGHEFVGEIVQASAAPQRIGQRVVGEINVACGKCPDCRAARHGHCPKRSVLGIKDRDGAFAEYLCLPLQLSSLVVDEITLVGSRCGPVVTALDQLEKKRVDPSGLVENRYFLYEALAAFDQAAAPGALKILFQIIP